MFDLSTNPFYRLRVSIRATADDLARAAEEAIFLRNMDEQAARAAQRALMAPRSRLAAELAWLPDIAPARAMHIVREISGSDAKANASEILSQTDGLSGANIAAHCCAAGLAPEEAVLRLLQLQPELDPVAIADAINACRAVAGINSVAPANLDEALQDLRQLHSQAAAHAILSSSAPGKAMTALVEAFLHRDGTIDVLLHCITDRYEAATAQLLNDVEQAIDDLIVEITKYRHSPRISQVKTFLAQWDEYSQSLQLIHEAQGLDEPRSKEIYIKLRNLAIWLANEHDEYSRAKTISEALAETFPELPLVAGQLKEDLETLDDLVERSRRDAALDGLQSIISAIPHKPEEFVASLGMGQFAPEKRHTMAGMLYDELLAAIDATAKTELAEVPWMMARGVAVDLHNQNDKTDAAIALLTAVQALHPAGMPQRVQAVLKEDLLALQRQKTSQGLTVALDEKQWDKALAAIDKLLETAPNRESRNNLLQIKSEVARAKDQSTISYRTFQAAKQILAPFAGLGVTAGIALFIIISASLSSQDNGKSAGNQSPPKPARAVPTAPTPMPAPPPYSASSAPANDDAVLPLLTHTVERGDTLAKIAAAYSADLDLVFELNPQITSRDHIVVGQKIKVPTPVDHSETKVLPPTQQKLGAAPTLPAGFVPDLPSRETGALASPTQTNPAGLADYSAPLPLPSNGFVTRYLDAPALAPFGIVTRGDDNHYVKMTDSLTGRTVATIFVRAGQTAEMKMPLGSFDMKYASGDTWYGEEALFGPDTRRAKADDTFVFYDGGDAFYGHTVELVMQRDGNLQTRPISAAEF